MHIGRDESASVRFVLTCFRQSSPTHLKQKNLIRHNLFTAAYSLWSSSWTTLLDSRTSPACKTLKPSRRISQSVARARREASHPPCLGLAIK